MRAVLRLLGQQGSVGELRLRTPYLSGHVFLGEGRVLHASLDSVTRLGDTLVDRGLLERDQLDAALLIQRRARGKRPIGQILVELGFVERGDLRMAIERQIRAVVAEILSWREGSYAFEPNVEAMPDHGFGGLEIRDLVEMREAAR